MTIESHIKLENLGIGFISGKNCRTVFHGLNVLFESGNFIGIIGNNGLGKSTLIRTISGLQDPLEGRVFCNGKNINHITKTDLAKMLAVVLTERVSGFNLTVNDFVTSGRTPYTNAFHVLTGHDKSEVLNALALMGLETHGNIKLDELSDGMYQKAAIAKALAQKTAAIVLDEPTAFLDFSSKHMLFSDLKKISQTENKCILASSHDLDLVLHYCSHLLIMASDNRYAFIKSDESFQHPLFNEITKSYFLKT